LNLLFAMAGVGWAMININSLPTVVDMALLLRLVRLPVCITFLPKLHQLFLRHLLALSPIWQKVNTSVPLCIDFLFTVTYLPFKREKG